MSGIHPPERYSACSLRSTGVEPGLLMDSSSFVLFRKQCWVFSPIWASAVMQQRHGHMHVKYCMQCVVLKATTIDLLRSSINLTSLCFSTRLRVCSRVSSSAVWLQLATVTLWAKFFYLKHKKKMKGCTKTLRPGSRKFGWTVCALIIKQ